MFYQKKFISRDEKSDITSIHGVGERVKADKLMEIVVNKLRFTRDKEKLFHMFTAIFLADGAYQELGITMEQCYAGNTDHYYYGVNEREFAC